MPPPFRHFRLETDDRGQTTAWIDVAGRSVNVFDGSVVDELRLLVEQFHAAPPQSVVLRSAKPGGFAGGADLKYLASLNDLQAAEQFLTAGQVMLDRLESLACPTVAVIRGPCVGGGLEVALACRFRVVERDKATALGLPETTLGLIPGWGGTLRLPERIGVAPALRMMLTGELVGADEGLTLGLVDALYDSAEVASVLPQVVTSPPGPRRTIPAPFDPHRVVQELDTARRQYCGGGATQAQEALLSAVAAGVDGTREEALRAEREHCARLLFTPECRARLEAFFQSRGRGTRPKVQEPTCGRD